jgi:serine/threonine protein kinase
MVSIEKYKVDHLMGQQVGTCTIIKELARGGMGIVFVAFQNSLKRQIAVKIVPKAFLDEDKAESFQLEAEAAAILSHPNIIPIYEIGETDEFLFFTMQLVQGEALSDILRRLRKTSVPSQRMLPLKEVTRIMIQVLDALDYAHREEIVHRDIKPENILMEEHSQRALISDFGVATFVRGEDVERGIQGTPRYMAPEQIRQQDIDGRTDIYAAGTMLFELLVPALPLPKSSTPLALLKQKVAYKEGIFLQKPTELNPQLNDEMDSIIAKATAYDPEERYETCGHFKNALERYHKRYLDIVAESL